MCKRKSSLVLLFSILFLRLYSAPLSRIDSLIMKCEAAKEDSTKAKLLNLLSGAYNNMGYANDKSLDAGQEALAIALKHSYAGIQISAWLNIGNYFQLKGDEKQALDNFLKAEDIADKSNGRNAYVLGLVYDRLSQFYRSIMRNYKKALEYSHKDILLMKEAGAKMDYAVALTNMGNIYYDMDSTRQALKYYLESSDFFMALHNDANLADAENNIGSSYEALADNDKKNTGPSHEALKDYNEALDYYQRALALYQKLNNKGGIAMCYGNIGNVYDMKGDPENGVKYSEQDLRIAGEINSKDNVAAAYIYLSEGYKELGDYKKAYQYDSALSILKDTMFSEASSKQVNDMQVKYDTEKKDKENKILELNVNRQKLINYSISLGLLLVMALAFFIYRGYVNKKKAHAELEEKNKIIEEKNKDILDSINYAKTIQNAILTPDEYLKDELKDYFIVYKPRDVVSGDFYWCYAHGSKVIFTVADCTGHGVPGAFMSMIGNSLLNEVVIENKITDAAQILNTLRTNLLKTLQQKGGQSNITRDGMDIALCVWDKSTNTIEFAGANNPMYLMRNKVSSTISTNDDIKVHGDNLVEFLPDKQPIGYFENKTNEPFHSQRVQLQKGDIVYISTDGYIDQFGGEKGKKFTRRQFRDTLSSLTGKGLEEQKNILDKTIESWKGSTEQTDDICLMGIKFS
jgi:serine phosphatase RsbU (regulator of sigma subunit)